MPAGDSQQACSFCGMRRDQAEGVVVRTQASPAICSPCLVLCEQMLAERQ